MDDRGARLPAELARRDQAGQRGRRHHRAPFVHEEASVGVAVEGETDVGALVQHPLLQIDEVLGLDRVGLVVGEGAVELEVELRQAH